MTIDAIEERAKGMEIAAKWHDMKQAEMELLLTHNPVTRDYYEIQRSFHIASATAIRNAAHSLKYKDNSDG